MTRDPIELPRQTVGAAAVELLSKGDQSQGVLDTQREMSRGYIDELIKCALKGVELYGSENPYYVCVQTRRERLLTNVIRSQFYTRRTRPAPQYDLALYWYNPKSQELRFVWNIPDKETVMMMMDDAYVLPRGEEQLYGFVKSFVEGTLV